jgi:general secretion pathway protein C
MKRWSVLVSFVLFIALCISLTYWAIKLFKPSVRPVAAPPQARHVEINMAAAAALFGGRPASAAVASNFQLKGVVVADKPDESVAILSTDGKPPQSVAANAEVMPGVTVKEVHPKYVLLSDGGVTKRVELPEGAQQLRIEPANMEAAAQPAPAAGTPTILTAPPADAQSAPPPANMPGGSMGQRRPPGG